MQSLYPNKGRQREMWHPEKDKAMWAQWRAWREAPPQSKNAGSHRKLEEVRNGTASRGRTALLTLWSQSSDPDLDFRPPEPWESKFLLFYITMLVVIYYSSHRKLIIQFLRLKMKPVLVKSTLCLIHICIHATDCDWAEITTMLTSLPLNSHVFKSWPRLWHGSFMLPTIVLY